MVATYISASLDRIADKKDFSAILVASIYCHESGIAMNSSVSSPMSTTHVAELFGLLLGGSDSMFGLKDLDHRYYYVNRALELAFGATPGSLIGKRADGLVSPEEAQATHEKEDMVISSGQPARFSERLQTATGLMDCVTIRFPVRDSSGSIVGIGFVGQKSSGDRLGAFEIQEALEHAQKTIGELQLLLEQMKLQAAAESITGVLNRRQIEEGIRLEMARMERYNHPFSLVFIDIDHFKLINDSFGHAIGDQVLKEFCQIILSRKRTTDMLGRWGGDEFLLLLPNTGRASARLVSERIRVAIERHHFPGVGRSTASFGISSVRRNDITSDMIARAETALHAAKQQGRNRIETDLAMMEPDEEPEIVGTGFVRLVWHRGYECGHTLIDRQHRKLFEDANSLLDGVIGGQPKEEIMQLIDVLLQDVVQHFEDEEALFNAAGFPDADMHSRIHAAIVAKALDMSVRYAADRLTVGELFNFLVSDVVASHMLSDDRKFFPYIAQIA